MDPLAVLAGGFLVLVHREPENLLKKEKRSLIR
jgi:hypothetical protein